MTTKKTSQAPAKTLGTLLRESREKSGQSQAELAVLLATSQGNLSRWERDLSYPQDVETLLAIERIIKVSRSTFIAAVVASVAENTRAHLLKLFSTL